MRTPILICLALATGCAPPVASAPSASPRPNELLAIYQELARCFRANGMPDLPDPILDPRTGEVALPDGAGGDKYEPTQAQQDACRSIIDKLPARHGAPKYTAEEIAKLREFARCMRANGLQAWPDPDADGAFPLPRELDKGGKAAFGKQMQACDQHLPNGKGFTVKEPAGG